MPKSLCKQTKEVVRCLINYFETERDNGGPLLPLCAVRERAAEACGLSIATISRISTASKENQPLSSPKRKRTRAKPTVDVDDATQIAIRNVIYEMYRNRQHVTRKSLLSLLKERELYSRSLSSLGKALKKIAFRWKKDDRRRGLMELQHIALARVDFLQKYVQNMRKNLYSQCVYLDETWIFENGSGHWSWQDDNLQTVKTTKSEGKRYIVLHAGSRYGFIPGASLIFSSSTKNPDYHGEMTKDTFLKWFQQKLLPNLKPKSLIIMDNASYHSEIANKAPDSSWRKADIQNWLSQRNFSFDNDMLKPQLLHLVSLHKPPKEYVIDNIAVQHGHKILRLPPYHCIFNPIENIWGLTKNYYNKHIGRNGFGVANCLKMWDEALQTITVQTWVNTIEHTEAEIIRWWEREVGMDHEDVCPLIINLEEDSSSCCESDSDAD